MAGIEWILLLIGSIFMIGSFFITEKLSPSELNKIAELSENELKRIIERGLGDATGKIEMTIEDQLDASTEMVERALAKVTNDKIMAISEYSDTVVEGMNKTHNEIMFLYSMLNDKHTELTGMVSDLQRLAADVRNLEENFQVYTLQPETPVMPEPVLVSAPVSVAASAQEAVAEVVKEATVTDEATKTPTQLSERENVNRTILALYKQGLSEVEIARKLGMGIGEIRLVIGLYRGE